MDLNSSVSFSLLSSSMPLCPKRVVSKRGEGRERESERGGEREGGGRESQRERGEGERGGGRGEREGERD